ncbi:HalOD1 output domain-containing protein [Natrarchaeobius oligotrophus]|uniref:Halobacterial output domain-containing protein n=1 Tax=Natrarchaeobius chitinivorans TaxID=1679083 RepID=A0A3N6MYG5_NATCH|nr:HalOD1 output domain-containing protein [Natrarchaeobius chitinivorans]RQH03131.1 hypothetical protein EA472_00595 [Natrarchaeobius chitinivorans]
MLLSVDRSQADSDQSLSFEIIAAIAEREGVDPIDIEPPKYDALYETINPEALDSLFAPRANGTARTTGHVEFPYCGYLVVVSSDGDVEIRELPDHG